MDSTFVEEEMAINSVLVLNLVQSELDRYKIVSQIISDYFESLDKKPLQESQEKLVFDIMAKIEEAPPYENLEITDLDNVAERFPFQDKVVQNSLKILEGEEPVDTDDKNKLQAAGKGGKPPPLPKGAKAPPPVKGAKGAPPGKGGKDQHVEEEEKKEPTMNELKMQDALLQEKMCTRYRICMIQEFALQNLLNMRNAANTLYDKLDDWIEYAYKIENDALEDMVNLFLKKKILWNQALIMQEHIEDENKIQTEIQMTNYDVIVSNKILNFYTPPIVIQPAIEAYEKDRFTITNLLKLRTEIMNLADMSGFIENKTQLLFFSRMMVIFFLG